MQDGRACRLLRRFSILLVPFYNDEVEFKDFLRTCTKEDGTPLSERSIDHYESGLRVASEDMLRQGVISKPLMDMNLFELDVAIEIIRRDPFFEAKDKRGKRMYRNALKHYRLYVYSLVGGQDSAKDEERKIILDSSLQQTEREAIVQARIGQGIYREKLLRKYNNRCIITGINLSEILIASHIKPWAASSNKERISLENGLLLSATYDRLFDQGLMSFENDGKILLSSMVTKDNAEKLRLSPSMKYDIKYDPGMKDYLDYHRNIIFIR